jgi:hypothetical protein
MFAKAACATSSDWEVIYVHENELQTREGLDRLEASEILSLNAADLDIEELESRLELATAVPNADCWTNVCLVHF